ncbi:DUF5958 family protein [Streptomyces sp. DT190]|jgi:hypothetical protein|uniref:DUF5958 family protein n=1 Tax=unclassified Streptomyces TaxID=2593676 RepID=UPI003CEA4938
MAELSRDDGHPFRCEVERVVNEAAQGLRTLDACVGWFCDLAPTRRQEVLREVAGYAMQAHVTAADGRAGVARSGVKTTANPAVMICMDPPRYGFADLPAAEHVAAFRVLVSAFAVADARRRATYCQGACGHPWHNLGSFAGSPAPGPDRVEGQETCPELRNASERAGSGVGGAPAPPE